jgi:hypothetical protein
MGRGGRSLQTVPRFMDDLQPDFIEHCDHDPRRANGPLSLPSPLRKGRGGTPDTRAAKGGSLERRAFCARCGHK